MFVFVSYLILFVIILYSLFILPTKWLKVEKVQHDLGLKIKILQISDIHIKNLRVNLKTIQKVINRENPNYIFLTGDFIDRSEAEFEKLEKFLKVISGNEIEIFSVLGNHDRYIKDEKKVIEIIKKYGIKVMLNESIEKEGYYLIGIDDYCKRFHNIRKAFLNVKDDNKKRIILTHDPEIVLNLHERYHYLMAGHLHGKQINIPFLFKFKRMGNLADKGNYKGKHITKFGTYYISKGISQTRYNVRFLVRSEVTIHEL